MTNTGTGSKKTCLTCNKYDGSVCKIDGFIMGSRDCSCEMYKERPHSSDSEKQSVQQAITDKERREIAASLRQIRKKMDGEKPPQIPTLAAAVYLLRIAKAVKCGVSGALFYRLADLIDQPTCTFNGHVTALVTSARIAVRPSRAVRSYRAPMAMTSGLRFPSDTAPTVARRWCGDA